MQVKLPVSGYWINLTIDDGMEDCEYLGELVFREALRRWESKREEMKALYRGKVAKISLVKRSACDKEITVRGPEIIRGETPRPKKKPVGYAESVEKRTLRERAEEILSEFPQYRNYWNGPEWRVARAKSRITVYPDDPVNYVIAEKGELVLAMEEGDHIEPDYVRIFSFHKKYHIQVPKNDIEFLEPKPITLVKG
jgi:hypothetical protein